MFSDSAFIAIPLVCRVCVGNAVVTKTEICAHSRKGCQAGTLQWRSLHNAVAYTGPGPGRANSWTQSHPTMQIDFISRRLNCLVFISILIISNVRARQKKTVRFFEPRRSLKLHHRNSKASLCECIPLLTALRTAMISWARIDARSVCRN